MAIEQTTRSDSALQGCPFCGWPAALFDSSEAPFWVECSDCFAQGAPEDTATEAIAAWNRRDAKGNANG